MIRPSGNVTFLFTDIEGSTKLSQDHPELLADILNKHNSILNEAVISNNGFVFKTAGDAFCCSFQNADDAVYAAVDAQKKFSSDDSIKEKLKVRIGIHSGNVEWNGTEYMGYITLARSSRVMSAAHGRQILLTDDAYRNVIECIDSKNREILNEKNRSAITFRDLGEKRLKDLIQPLKLYQVISSEIHEDFPRLKTLDARANNLPLQLASFIGREEELRMINEIFKNSRLLTLVGSGGAGKTRMAIQVGAEMIDNFANGVFMIEFAPVSDPSMIVQTILNSIEAKEEPGKSPEEILVSFLKKKEMLLILDNCEHLVRECAVIAEMLIRNCEKLKIIATSRQTLNCSGEHTYRVPSLTVPDVSENNTPEKLAQYESVRLFIERALDVNKDFRVTDENAPALARICSQLDGIPLAIELAAVRIKVLTPESICDRLDHRFKLLTGGKRTSLPRQQTLKALIDWSYDLLSDNEKILWSRLSVFSGGWTLEAAEKICSDEEITEDEILDLLGSLLEKSVIIYDMEMNRYRILETIKQYGEYKLNESGNSENFRSKLLDHYLNFSELSEPLLRGSETQAALIRLEEEHDNFQSAISWSLKNGKTESGARLICALGNYWFIRGYYSTGRMLMESVLENKSQISEPVLAKLLNLNAILAMHQGEYEKAEDLCNESLAIHRNLNNESGISGSLNSLGILEFLRSNYEKAQKFNEESLGISTRLKDKTGIANSLFNIGRIEKNTGNFEIAKRNLEESYSLRKEIGNKSDIADSLYSLGNLSYEQESFEKAKVYFEQSLELRYSLGDKRGIAQTLNNLGSLSADLGNIEDAMKYFEESLAIRIELGDKRSVSGTLLNLGIINSESENGSYEKSRMYYAESLSIKTELKDKRGIAESLNCLGILECNNYNYDQSEKYLCEGLPLSREVGDMDLTGNLLISLGTLEYYRNSFDKSAKFFEESLAIFGRIGVVAGVIESLIGFAGVFSKTDRLQKSVKLTGAIETALISCSIVLQKSQKRLRQEIEDENNKKLSSEVYSDYFEEGKKLKLEDAIILTAG